MNDTFQIQRVDEPHEFFKEVFLGGGPKISKVDLGSRHQSSPFSGKIRGLFIKSMNAPMVLYLADYLRNYKKGQY
jgi:hypothetical protein